MKHKCDNAIEKEVRDIEIDTIQKMTSLKVVIQAPRILDFHY